MLYCRRCALLAVMLLATALSDLAGTAQAQQPASTVIIFDGSGSMWAKLDGEKQTKLVEARDALRAALAKLPPQSSQIGLVSFGHRRQGDCSDVQLIAPLEAVAPPALTDRILAPLEKLNPKGKGPLTAALREAAKALGKAPAPRHIVMLHDDPDNCQADPCSALSELQQAAPGVIISIIGLGLKPEDAPRYQCLTQPTGGQLFNATDGAQILADIDRAIQFTAMGLSPAAPRAAPKPTNERPSAPSIATATPAGIAKPLDLVTAGPPALHLRALIVKDRLPEGHQLHWAVYAESAPPDAAPLARLDGNDIDWPAPPGSYRVRVASGFVSGEGRATVGTQGQAPAEITLDAAELRLTSAVAADATLIIAERPPTTGSATPQSAEGIKRLGIWPYGQTAVLVPPKPLWLLLEQGEVRAEWPIDIAAGQSREFDTSQNGGRVDLSLAPTAGPPIAGASSTAQQPVVFALEEDDPDASHGRREIARSAAASPEFIVPPGVYIISASRGSLLVRERISVSAGETVRRALPLLASRLFVSAKLGVSGTTDDESQSVDRFRIARLDTETEMTLLLPGPAAIADVPPGRYHVEARHGTTNLTVEKDVEVKAGEYRAVPLSYEAGQLHIAFAALPDAGLKSLSWRIIDAKGRIVALGYEASSAQILQAGHYSIEAVVLGQPVESGVDIRAGEETTLQLELRK